MLFHIIFGGLMSFLIPVALMFLGYLGIKNGNTIKIMNWFRQPKESKAPHEELTDREMEVLRLIAQGKSNQELADELFIGIKTVKFHITNIFAKLRVEDRTQAAIYAFKHGLVE
jgi:NarL family two-component system response regulator LiaR